ncbi:MAG: hypothetical protein GXP40_13010 [Chloroflexi bacterium]|nr:hypothetical protein [Chloroflexota bacterium]
MTSRVKPSTKKLLTGLFGTMWLLAVLLGYAYTHKPFTPAQALVLARSVWQMIVALGIISLAGGLGAAVLSGQMRFSPLTALALQAALGLGALGLGIFLAGVTVGFSPVLFWALLLGAGISLRKSVWAWWRQWAALEVLWRESGRFDKFLAAGVGFILVSALATALAPPLQFDALVYHLTLPRAYLLAGRMIDVPEVIFWGMPQQTEMLYTFALALGGLEAAVVVGWAVGALALVGLLGYAAERFSPRAAWIALAALLAGWTLSDGLSWGYAEWSVMLYGFSVLAALDAWRENDSRRMLLLAAVFAGFALGTKYTAGILLLGGAAVIFSVRLKDGGKAIFGDLLLFAGVAVLVTLPWWIKNFAATGNPFYPLLFPSGAMDSYRLDFYQNDPAWGDWRDLLLLPWRATIWGLDGKVGYSAAIGPLLLGLSALSWVGWRARVAEQRRALFNAAGITLVGLLVWAVAGRTSRLLLQSRLYFAVFPAWAVLSGAGFEAFARLRAGGIRFGRIAAALVALAFGFNLFATGATFARRGVAGVLLGVQTPASYREQTLGAYEPAMQSLAKLPPDARVLMLWETRSLSCWPQCEPDEVIDRWYDDLRVYRTADATLEAWRAAGYTHVLYNRLGAEFIRETDDRYADADWRALDDLLQGLALVEDFDGVYQLYALGGD